MNTLLDFILIGGIIISVQILFLLLKAKKKELPQKLLTLFFGVILFYLITGYAVIHEIVWLYSITFIFCDFIEVFIGPLLFLYVKSLFVNNSGLIKKNWVHFLPSAFYIVFISAPYLISILKASYAFDYLRHIDKNDDVISLFFLIYLISYLFITINLFNKYSKAIKSSFSSITENDYGWIKSMLYGLLTVAIIDLGFISYGMFIEKFSWEIDYLTASLVVVLIAHLGYYGVNQSKILLPDFLVKKSKSSGNKMNQLSGVTKDELEKLQIRIEDVLKTQKPYLDEDLTLGKLAELIPTSDKKLSTILNQYMNTTFYDIVNKYRFEEVKQKITAEDSQQYSLIGLAYDCGFKSKTSFYRVFKKETGLSPSEYKKSLLNLNK